jgi:hypothetical protein
MVAGPWWRIADEHHKDNRLFRHGLRLNWKAEDVAMRATGWIAVLCATVLAQAAPVVAAEKGQIGVHLGLAPDETPGARRPALGFELSYQLSERLSLRPSLSLAHSSASEWSFSLGGDAFYHFRPGKAWSPYVGAGLLFRYRDPVSLPAELQIAPLPDRVHRSLTFSTALGIERSLGRRLSLFGEMRAAYTPAGHPFEERFDVTPIVGMTLKLR